MASSFSFQRVGYVTCIVVLLLLSLLPGGSPMSRKSSRRGLVPGTTDEGGSTYATHVDIGTTQVLADRISRLFRGIACNHMRSGAECQKTGLQDQWKKMQREKGFHEEVKMRPQEDLLDNDVLSQVDKVFKNTSKMLITLRDELENSFITRHRISILEVVNRSEMPLWDAAHPRLLYNTETVLEGRVFNRPVLKTSTLKYPPFVDKAGRVVMIAANASQGLDETFVQNLINPDYSFLRWQRFVSNTGLTRQFPAAYDISDYDNRLTNWYNMASQPPKRVIFIVDLSTNMGQNQAIEIAQATVNTLLDTLISEDLVNVILMDDATSIYNCFEKEGGSTLVPATEENIESLKRYVSVASVGGSRNQLASALSKAAVLLEETDLRVLEAERKRSIGNGCDGYRCGPVHEFVIVVSDGDFEVTTQGIQEFREISRSRPLLSAIGVAVGLHANEAPIRAMACNMKGLFFRIKGEPPRGSGSQTYSIHPSYILNEMNAYFQLVAAPLARNHSKFKSSEMSDSFSLDVTWALPRISSDARQLIVTLALPCFGDIDSSTPRLLGVVAVDLLFLSPGADIGNSIFSYFTSVVNPPIDSKVNFALVYKQGYGQRSFLDQTLIKDYGMYVDGLTNYAPIVHYLFEDYVGDDFKAAGVMNQILAQANGTVSLKLNIRVENVMDEWKLEPMYYVEEVVTYTWRHVIGHPFVLVIRVKGVPDDQGYISFTGVSPALNRDSTCTSDDGSQSSCWSLPARHIVEGFSPANVNNTLTGSWLYLPPPAYKDIAIYLLKDAALLPPYCDSGKRISACDYGRINELMNSINFGKASVSEAGGGLSRQALIDIYFTSLVDQLWNETFASPDALEYVSRLFLSTNLGVFRTRGRAQYANIALPFLYQPTSHFWYSGSLGKNSKLMIFPPSHSYFDARQPGPDVPSSVLTMTQPLNSGKEEAKEEDIETAAVIGAEIIYDKIHAMIYGPDRYLGETDDGNEFSCGDMSAIGYIRCIVINDAGVVITLPEFGTAGPGRTVPNASGPVFLGSVEPRVMQVLVEADFFIHRAVIDVTVTNTNWGKLEGYVTDDSVLPLETDLHGEVHDGLVHVVSIKGTNTYLVVIDMYSYEQSSVECNFLNFQCPKVKYPSASPFIRDKCELPIPDTAFKAAGAYALLPDYSHEAVITSLQLTDNCTVPIPPWIWQLVLGGAGFICIVLTAIGIRSFLYKQKRKRWFEKRREADKGNNQSHIDTSHAGHTHEGKEDTSQQFNAFKDNAKIVALFDCIRLLASKAQDIDDYRNVIEQQTELIMTLSDCKSMAQAHDDEQLESLGTSVGRIRTLASNLQHRLSAHEVMRVQTGSRQGLKSEVHNLEKQFGELQRKLEAMVLPSVSIQASAVSAAQPYSPRSRERQSSLLVEERAFYTSHYPHLFKYEGDGASVRNVTREVSGEDDMTDRSLPSQSFVHDGTQAAAAARQELADRGGATSLVSAFLGAGVTPRSHGDNQ